MTVIMEMTREFIAAGGGVTCEMSTGPISIQRILVEMQEANDLLESSLDDGCHHLWIIRPCRVCEEHSPESIGHVEIVTLK